MLIEHERAAAAPTLHNQIDRKMIVQPLDALLPHRLGDQHPDHFIPGGIASGTQNSAPAVRRLPGERKFAAGFVEPGSPLDQLLDALRSLPDQDAHGFLPAQPVAGLECIGQMDRDVIFLAQRDCNATLRMD
jgi:hypothetical protein